MLKFTFFSPKDYYRLAAFLIILSGLIFIITNPIVLVEKVEVNFLPAETEKLQTHVEYLAGLSPARNYLNTTSLQAAARYIREDFSQYCETTEEQVFKVKNIEYTNVICSFHKEGVERIIVGAHYDSFNELPGADDNASGVAGALELARMLAVNHPVMEERIDIVAYSLEEPPFFSSSDMGSFRHATALREESTVVKIAIVLEMIGYYSDQPQSQALPTALLRPFYPDKGDFITIIGAFGQWSEVRGVKRNLQEVMETKVYSLNGPTFIAGVDYSDHRSYWNQNYSAVMITDTSFSRNKNYHTAMDMPSTLNYTRMADVVNGVYWAVINYERK